MGAGADTRTGREAGRRWGIDVAILVAIGLLMGFLGPFSSDHVPIAARYLYWMICMVGGGVIGFVADDLLKRRLPGAWTRTVVVSAAMTPLVTLFVMTTERLLMGGPFVWGAMGGCWCRSDRSFWR
ncbi:hypothetical protein [Brevundimonas sp. LM2]|uniref:hypothetical protein n=1 Tax=Brevundimonas sp. LM2 TaxID=1938605 RepID=UPI00209B0B67|nr:hypothetical protein [Brevundimonas sp. LM2]